MTDKLEEIVRLQTEFMNRLGVAKIESGESLNGENYPIICQHIQDMIPHFMFALVCEMGEIGDAINWKSWKSTKKKVDMDNLRMEFIDALHFLLEMMIMCGMDAETIYKEYVKKMEENHRRQDNGY